MTATNLNDLRQGKPAAPGTDAVVARPRTMAEIQRMPKDKQAITMMETFKNQFAAALPAHLPADRMVRLAMTALRQNPALLYCDPASVFAAVLVASQMGLEIGIDGQGYLVPYKGEATFIPGWKGYVELINRAGKAGVWTGAVFEGDQFEYALGDSPHVTHRPTGMVDETRANLRYVYAIGRLHDGKWPVIEVWPAAKVERHLKKFNKVGGKHYALKDDTNFIAYARKVALLQVMKYMPKSVELRAAMAIESKGSVRINMDDVLQGEWTHVAAELGESTDGGSVEDQAEGVDMTAGQEAAATEQAESGQPSDSVATGADPSPSPAEQATAAAESPKQDAKPPRRRRVIE